MLLDISFSTPRADDLAELERHVRSADGGAVLLSPGRWLVDTSTAPADWVEALVGGGAEMAFVSRLRRGDLALRLPPEIVSWLEGAHRVWDD